MSTDTTTALAEQIDAWVKAHRGDSDVWFDEMPVSGADWDALEGYEWPGVELIEGRVRMAPPPNRDHQAIIGNLFAVIRERIIANLSGELLVSPFEIIIDSKTRPQPDIGWFVDRHDELPIFVVEVLSPSNHRYDRIEKKAIYEKAEIPHYWIVDPLRKDIEAFELQDGRYVEVGDVKNGIFQAPPFADLEIPLAEIFPQDAESS